MVLISHKTLLLQIKESHPLRSFSIMLLSEDKKTLKPSSKKVMLNKLKMLFHLSLEMKLILLTDKDGGQVMMSLAI